MSRSGSQSILGFTVLIVPVFSNRLDELHYGLRKYMDGKLCLAPLDSPKKILELGFVAIPSRASSAKLTFTIHSAGTGVWYDYNHNRHVESHTHVQGCRSSNALPRRRHSSDRCQPFVSSVCCASTNDSDVFGTDRGIMIGRFHPMSPSSNLSS